MDRLLRAPAVGADRHRRLSQQGREADEASLPGSIPNNQKKSNADRQHPRPQPRSPFAPLPLEVLVPPREPYHNNMSSSSASQQPPPTRAPRRTASGARSSNAPSTSGDGSHSSSRREVGRTTSLTNRRPTLSGTFGRAASDEPNRIIKPADREFSRERQYRANE